MSEAETVTVRFICTSLEKIHYAISSLISSSSSCMGSMPVGVECNAVSSCLSPSCWVCVSGYRQIIVTLFFHISCPFLLGLPFVWRLHYSKHHLFQQPIIWHSALYDWKDSASSPSSELHVCFVCQWCSSSSSSSSFNEKLSKRNLYNV